VLATVSDALDPAFDELLKALPEQTALYIDETGHPDTGERFWTWCFKAAMDTLFRLDRSRGSQVLLDVLGEEFDGSHTNLLQKSFLKNILVVAYIATRSPKCSLSVVQPARPLAFLILIHQTASDFSITSKHSEAYAASWTSANIVP
jgi:hypothetical protein